MIYPTSYSSVGEICSAFPPISSVTALSSAVIAQTYLGPVEAKINGAIAKRYALPVTKDCPILSAIARDEAIYQIVMSRLMTSFPAAQAGKATIQVQHDQNMKLLESIVNGDMQLLDSSYQVLAPATSRSRMIWSTTKDFVPTFHEGARTDQVIDPVKLDAIDDDRSGR